MIDSGDKDSKNERGLSPEDKEMWKEYVSDFVSSPEEKEMELESFADMLDGTHALEDQEEKSDTQYTKEKAKGLTHRLNKDGTKQQNRELDKKTEEKLRKGQIKIERKIDLHGMTQGEAFEALRVFIEESAARKCRCLLVVTGKGKTKSTSEDWLTPARGILKTRVPEWLSFPPFDSQVLRVVTAIPRHGGSGAYYIYLRRQRPC